MKIMTIGFTKSSAEKFFSRLKQSGTQRVVDVRLNNISQLAGFAKKNDLSYFLKELCGRQLGQVPAHLSSPAGRPQGGAIGAERPAQRWLPAMQRSDPAPMSSAAGGRVSAAEVGGRGHRSSVAGRCDFQP